MSNVKRCVNCEHWIPIEREFVGFCYKKPLLGRNVGGSPVFGKTKHSHPCDNFASRLGTNYRKWSYDLYGAGAILVPIILWLASSRLKFHISNSDHDNAHSSFVAENSIPFGLRTKQKLQMESVHIVNEPEASSPESLKLVCHVLSRPDFYFNCFTIMEREASAAFLSVIDEAFPKNDPYRLDPTQLSPNTTDKLVALWSHKECTSKKLYCVEFAKNDLISYNIGQQMLATIPARNIGEWDLFFSHFEHYLRHHHDGDDRDNDRLTA